MLGREMVDALTFRNATVDGMRHAELDITDFDVVTDVISGYDVVINAASWTDVDGAEYAEDSAMKVNGNGVAYLAATCESRGITLIHLSTDYVFDGASDMPYQEEAMPAPVNAYGRSKLAGEMAVVRLAPTRGYVVRTAWLYGSTGRNFVTTMLRAASRRDTIGVIDDQVGQPTWSRTLADRLADFGVAAHASSLNPGIYHATSRGEATWYELACAVFAEAGFDTGRIHPIDTEQYPLPARRPARSVLCGAKWIASGMRPLGHWREQIAAAMPAIIGDRGL